jgi:endo-1,4-beta-xylanase
LAAGEVGRGLAAIYERVTQLCLEAPNCTALVLWGFTDRYSWIPTFLPGRGEALPLDEDFKRKPAYRKLSKALKKAAPAPGPSATP